MAWVCFAGLAYLELFTRGEQASFSEEAIVVERMEVINYDENV